MKFFKKRTVITVVLVPFFLAMNACSNNVPSCSDKKTTDLAIEITKGELVKVLGAPVVNALKFKIVNIRTTDKNEKTGAYK